MTTDNDAAIRQWNTVPRAALEAMEPDGDFAKRHLINPVILRMLGTVTGRRILDAGCGHGYFSRMLAERGAQVTGVEPTDAMFSYAQEKESAVPHGIRYVRADLTHLPDLGRFDAVVCNMVLLAIPDWKPAMGTCIESSSPGGLFIFSITHPAFEQLRTTWQTHNEYRVNRYLEEYEIPQPIAPDYHRPISTYLNELTTLGCHLLELAEPGLTPELARQSEDPGLEGYVHLPNFMIVAARRL